MSHKEDILVTIKTDYKSDFGIEFMKKTIFMFLIGLDTFKKGYHVHFRKISKIKRIDAEKSEITISPLPSPTEKKVNPTSVKGERHSGVGE